LVELAARKLNATGLDVNEESTVLSIPQSLKHLVNPNGHCWHCGESFHREAFPLVYSEDKASNKLAMKSLIGQIKGSAANFVLMFCSWTCLLTVTDDVE
jgi:hypothetical protein